MMIFGSTTFATKWYVFIASHQLHRPATEPDAFCAISKLKSGACRYGSRSSHVSSLICSFGNAISLPKNCVSPIIFIVTSL